MNLKHIKETLHSIIKDYPQWLQEHQLRDVNRMLFHIGLALRNNKVNKLVDLIVCDLGGGNTLFTPAVAAIGAKKSILIDDLKDSDSEWIILSSNSPHKKLGVNILRQDLLISELSGVDDALDVVTCFNSMEHWHNSPKKLFYSAFDKLKPGGAFVLSTPNCVNLRKRFSALIGYYKWSALSDWYDAEEFRGHVREPSVDDLISIANDMGLNNIKIYGRNWMGYYSNRTSIRALTLIFDIPLRLFPTLCSDIYIYGEKSHSDDKSRHINKRGRGGGI